MNESVEQDLQQQPEARHERARLLILDDQTILREGLRALLEHDPALEVLAAVDNGAEAMRLAAQLKIDLLLVDVSMRATDGLGAIRELKRRMPGIRALVFTAQSNEDTIRAALQAGADGYLLKDGSRAELLMAIQSVLAGQRFISPAVSAHLVARYLQQPRTESAAPSRYDALTPREKQVLKLIAEGRRNREIAKYLFISVKTVEKHRSNLMHKMDLHNTAALTSLAMAKGLVGSSTEGAPSGEPQSHHHP